MPPNLGDYMKTSTLFSALRLECSVTPQWWNEIPGNLFCFKFFFKIEYTDILLQNSAFNLHRLNNGFFATVNSRNSCQAYLKLEFRNNLRYWVYSYKYWLIYVLAWLEMFTYHMKGFGAVEFSSTKESEKKCVVCTHMKICLGCNR